MKGKFLLAVLLFSLLAGCSKYEDGPLVSLRSRETRVTNVWRVATATNLSGADTTSAYYLKKWELTKEFSIIYSENQTKYFGKWQFTQNNENLEMVYDSLETETFIIKKLKEDEMILRNRDSEVTLNLVPVE